MPPTTIIIAVAIEIYARFNTAHILSIINPTKHKDHIYKMIISQYFQSFRTDCYESIT